MVKVVIVSYRELSDPVGNPTLCLSALRGLKRCHQCGVFKRHLQVLRGGKKHVLQCRPHLTGKALILLEEKERELEKLAVVRASLADLNDKLQA